MQLTKAIRELSQNLKDKEREEMTTASSEAETVASSGCSAPHRLSVLAAVPSPSPSASTASPRSCTTDQHAELTLQKQHVPIKVRLPLLESNHVRVHISSGKYRDIQLNPDDNTMQAVYEAIQAEFPAALLTTYDSGDASTAILRTDKRVLEVMAWSA